MLASDAWVGAAQDAAGSPPSAGVQRRGGTTEAGAAECDDEAKPIDTNEWFNR